MLTVSCGFVNIYLDTCAATWTTPRPAIEENLPLCELCHTRTAVDRQKLGLPFRRYQRLKMVDQFLSALATAWLITFVATTGLVTALAAESVWDSQVYFHALQDVLTTDPQ